MVQTLPKKIQEVKVAYIGHKPAYPKKDGGCMASAAFLHNLIEAGLDVYYAMLGTEKHPFDSNAFPEEIREKVVLESSPIDTSVRPLKAFQYLFKKGSYNVERFYSEDFAALLKNRLKEYQFDAVIFDNVFSARYLDLFRNSGIKTFIRTHNVEFEVWKTQAEATSNPLKKWYLKKLSKDLEFFEIDALNHVDGILSISSDDTKSFADAGVKTKTITIPVSIEIPDYTHDYSLKGIFHLGAMNWQPNINAVNKVISLLPELRQKDADLEFTVAGLQSEVYVPNDPDNGITVKGFVPDLEAFLKTQGILVSPILSGSGVRIKILEMMGYGIPVITTKRGAMGLEDTSGIVIADNDEAIKNAVYELRSDENKRKSLGNKAKSIVTLYHNPKAISGKILEFIKST